MKSGMGIIIALRQEIPVIIHSDVYNPCHAE